MKKRYVPISIVCGMLALLALGGQFVQAPASKELPVRLRMDNKGGDVVFNHSRHQDYVEKMGKNCTDCHHEGKIPNVAALPCKSCHVEEFDAKFTADHQKTLPKETCVRCHHAEFGKLTFNHEEHIKQYTNDCTDCHHDKSIEAEPQACNTCHSEKGDARVPSLRDAVHAKCEGCHADKYDKKMKGCTDCHQVLPGKVEGAQPKCNSCHYEKEGIPLPTTMAAYHGQCMGCHEKAESGPFGKKSCTSCHTR